MVVEEKIQAILVADSSLTAVVPTSRIKIPGDHQNLDRPYIIHFPVGGMRTTYSHNGLNGTREWSYQVSIFADEYADRTIEGSTVTGGRAIVDLVRDALTGAHDGTLIFVEPGSGVHRYEDDTEVHSFVVLLTVFEAL